ncbi:hypothetical protein QBC34DRAFT_432695 [Podospora aff. communis PSN243]|uniref:NAD(P)-binding protein n=1 Tax=Podospora aff. communis PSN243 TaxID=3040156 RepID=A0AAV9H420_9PEZI|nr:hypothetical protein QBC34DRAFT_432695 [Podospora aff. communis PSN243]
MDKTPKVWLITGATSGLGLSLINTLSSSPSNLIIATGRNITTRFPRPIPPNTTLLDLDVTSPLPTITSTITAALSIHGRIDVLVNNAGISRMSVLEEMDEKLLRDVLEVNLFGAVKVTQAVVRHMRERREGTVVFVGAGMGWVGLPFLGGYSMSKGGLTMFAETLQKEIAPFGLRTVIFEPGGFDSDLTVTREGEAFAQPPEAKEYVELFSKVYGSGGIPPSQGDVNKVPQAIIDVVKGEGLAKGRQFPLRVALGPDALDAIRQKCNEQLHLLDEWEDVSLSVMHEGRRETSRWLLDGCSMLNKS